MTQLGQTPILILPEGALRSTGRNVQKQNILAAKAVAETVKTTLGPKGMDKMLVDDLGDIVITNDGATIVEELDVEHPAAKMVIEVAKTQDEEVGDGTTTAVVLTGELLANAETLLDQGIHPTLIAYGFTIAASKAFDILDEISEKVSIEDTNTLKEIAETSITGKGAEIAKDKLSNLCVDAIRQVAEKEDNKISVDLDNIQIEKKKGGSTGDSILIKGMIIDKERAHPGMPKRVEKAKIALVDMALEIKKTETDAKIKITSSDQVQSFIQQEEKMLKDMVDNVKNSGANVLICQKDVDDLALHYLTKANILAVKSAGEDDMKKIAKATGAKIVTNVKDLNKEDPGYADIVEEEKIANEEMLFIRGCKNPKAVSILIRGGTEHVVDEAERSIHDALGCLEATVESGRVVAGGGAIEIELAKRLKEFAETVGGREQLAITEFSNAIEVIPRILAQSAGMDPIDTLVKLRSEHEKKKLNVGVDVIDAKIDDMWKKGVIEPTKIKIQAIKSSSEAAVMILRIDDMIAASKKNIPSGPPGGGRMPPY